MSDNQSAEIFYGAERINWELDQFYEMTGGTELYRGGTDCNRFENGPAELMKQFHFLSIGIVETVSNFGTVLMKLLHFLDRS